MPYYDHAGITIYHGDSGTIADTIESADLVFADPPYGVGFKYGTSYTDTRAGYPSFVATLAPRLCQLAPLVLVTPGIRNIWLWPPATWVLSWHKPGSTRRSDLGGFNTWEPVLMYGTRLIYQDAVRLPAIPAADTGDHPCPKPLALLTWLIAATTEPGDLVLDPFMGSGTTLRAAKNLGRRAIGIEIEEHYCEIAARRLGQEVLPLVFEQVEAPSLELVGAVS